MPDNFITIPFTIENLDLFVVRNAILKALNEPIPLFNGRLLDIGCGKMPYKNYIHARSSIEVYIGLDIENATEYDAQIKPDFTWNGIAVPFEDDSFDCIMATEVLEHCPDTEQMLREVLDILGTHFTQT